MYKGFFFLKQIDHKTARQTTQQQFIKGKRYAPAG
jgi:hypothetical protein